MSTPDSVATIVRIAEEQRKRLAASIAVQRERLKEAGKRGG